MRERPTSPARDRRCWRCQAGPLSCASTPGIPPPREHAGRCQRHRARRRDRGGGKLTEAAVTHHGAKVTFKLVNRSGGEALADTQWSLHSAQGDLVRESFGALPTHILVAGSYVASARHGGQTYRREFAIAADETMQIELVYLRLF